MSVGITGFRPISPRNFLLHEGAAFLNVNMEKLRSTLGFSTGDWAAAILAANTWTSAAGNVVAPALFGATRGGGKVDVNAPITQIPDIDGIRGPVMELDIRNSAECMITVTVLELRDKQTMEYALGAADLDEWDSYHEITPRMDIQPGDYLPNIAFAVSVNDVDVVQPFVCVLENALVVNAFSFQSKRGDAAGVSLELHGRAPLTDPLALPIHMFLPRRSASGS